MKSSLIILTYNELEEGTIPCVESIYKYTEISDFELIIVDNCSTDGTQDYLKKLKEQYTNVKIQLNEQNKGFAAGINDGLKLADGEFLFILNNDIMVTPDWLNKLVEPLKNNPETGLIGPITNSSGNEQCVYFENLDKNNYIELTSEYTDSQKGELYYTKRLAFFCVGMKRDVFDKVGFLDENFGIGWFEDDDYCLRVLDAGYKIAIAEDCFIYHHGSLSFSKGANSHAKQNEIYFNKKHNCTWTLSHNAIPYLNKIKADMEKAGIENLDLNIQRAYRRLQCFELCLNNMKTEEEAVRSYYNSLTPLGHLRNSLRLLERTIRKKLKRK